MIVIKKYLPYGIVILLIVLMMLFIFRKVPLPGSDRLYDHIQRQNDSLRKEDSRKAVRLREFEKSDDSLKAIIQNNNERIQKIYIEVEKKVSVYDTFTVQQLERFFSDRYR